MPLNRNYWNLWKQSEEGRKVIRLFEDIEDEKFLLRLFEKYNNGSDAIESVDYILDLLGNISKPEIPENLINETAAEDFFNLIVDEGLKITFDDGEVEINDASELLFNIPEISTWLYLIHPKFYKPYFFRNKFSVLTRIADAFDIELPPIPLKRYKVERLKYYWKLCESFLKFQEKNKMTSAEFCAFLYNFAPEDIEQSALTGQTDLPESSQIWMIGGNKSGIDYEFLDNLSDNSISFWQGNEDTKRGDILVMYCLAPYSCIHSIWRATTDGIADPFFHWYGSIYIGHGQKVTPIKINELKGDSYFSKHPLVRKNLQGVSGYQLTTEDRAFL